MGWGGCRECGPGADEMLSWESHRRDLNVEQLVDGIVCNYLFFLKENFVTVMFFTIVIRTAILVFN